MQIYIKYLGTLTNCTSIVFSQSINIHVSFPIKKDQFHLIRNTVESS